MWGRAGSLDISAHRIVAIFKPTFVNKVSVLGETWQKWLFSLSNLRLILKGLSYLVCSFRNWMAHSQKLCRWQQFMAWGVFFHLLIRLISCQHWAIMVIQPNILKDILGELDIRLSITWLTIVQSLAGKWYMFRSIFRCILIRWIWMGCGSKLFPPSLEKSDTSGFPLAWILIFIALSSLTRSSYCLGCCNS